MESCRFTPTPGHHVAAGVSSHKHATAEGMQPVGNRGVVSVEPDPDVVRGCRVGAPAEDRLDNGPAALAHRVRQRVQQRRSPDGEPGDRRFHLPALAGRHGQDETVTAAHAQERMWLTVPAGAEPPLVFDDLERRPWWPRPEPSLQVQLEEGGRSRAGATGRWSHAPWPRLRISPPSITYVAPVT